MNSSLICSPCREFVIDLVSYDYFNRCTTFTGSFDISGMFRNITLEDPGKPLRKHAAGVASFCR